MAESTCLQLNHQSFVLNVPLIVDRILYYLPAKALNQAAQVCKCWSELAKKIKNKRQDLSWVFWNENESNSSLISNFTTHLNNISTQPILSINFWIAESDDPCEIIQTDNAECQPKLPSDCKIVSIQCSGIIGMKQNECTEVENEELNAISVFYLPRIQGVQFSVRKLTPKHFKDNLPDLSKDTSIKALILISSDFNITQHLTKAVDHLMTRHNYQLAVAGAFTKKISKPKSSTLAISFSGERVKAASIVIGRNVRKVKQLEENLKRLKNYNLPEERSFAFIFACVARGSSHYGSESVEIREFRKMFPKTPLFGFYGSGELGSETCTEVKGKTKNAKMKYYHTYSSVIVLISIC